MEGQAGMSETQTVGVWTYLYVVRRPKEIRGMLFMSPSTCLRCVSLKISRHALDLAQERSSLVVVVVVVVVVVK